MRPAISILLVILLNMFWLKMMEVSVLFFWFLFLVSSCWKKTLMTCLFTLRGTSMCNSIFNSRQRFLWSRRKMAIKSKSCCHLQFLILLLQVTIECKLLGSHKTLQAPFPPYPCSRNTSMPATFCYGYCNTAKGLS